MAIDSDQIKNDQETESYGNPPEEECGPGRGLPISLDTYLARMKVVDDYTLEHKCTVREAETALKYPINSYYQWKQKVRHLAAKEGRVEVVQHFVSRQPFASTKPRKYTPQVPSRMRVRETNEDITPTQRAILKMVVEQDGIDGLVDFYKKLGVN